MPRIHPSAVVEPGAKIADDVVIGACAVVGSEVELAAGVELRPHAHVWGRTTVGEGSENDYMGSLRSDAALLE